MKSSIWWSAAEAQANESLELFAILRLINDRELMGPHVNGRVYNALAWTIAVVVSVLSLVLIGMTGMEWLG